MAGRTRREGILGLLVVGAGPFQVELLRAAGRHAWVVAVDGDPNAPGLALADDPRVVDVRDLRAVVALARDLQVDGVITGASDVAVPAVSAVVAELGLRGLSHEVAERCRDKQQAFEAMRAARLAVPESRAVHGREQALRAVDEVGGFPVVIKPRSGGGGRGVSIVADPEELGEAVARAQAAYMGLGESGVLVQERVFGRSLGAEACFVDGRLREVFVLDDQFDASYVSPIGHSLPPAIEPAIERAVVQAVDAFGVALGLTTCVVNLDLREVDGVILPIEVNPRPGGNSIAMLVEHTYGADLASAAVLCALGQDPATVLARRRCQPVAVRLILGRGHGVAHVPAAIEALFDEPGILALELTVREAEPTAMHVDDFTLLGRCAVRGESAAEAVEAAERLSRRVAELVRIDPHPAPEH